jgi:hypothetical protein
MRFPHTGNYFGWIVEEVFESEKDGVRNIGAHTMKVFLIYIGHLLSFIHSLFNVCTALSWALASLSLFQFSNLFYSVVGHLRRLIRPAIGRYLHI